MDTTNSPSRGDVGLVVQCRQVPYEYQQMAFHKKYPRHSANKQSYRSPSGIQQTNRVIEHLLAFSKQTELSLTFWHSANKQSYRTPSGIQQTNRVIAHLLAFLGNLRWGGGPKHNKKNYKYSTLIMDIIRTSIYRNFFSSRWFNQVGYASYRIQSIMLNFNRSIFLLKLKVIDIYMLTLVIFAGILYITVDTEILW